MGLLRIQGKTNHSPAVAAQASSSCTVPRVHASPRLASSLAPPKMRGFVHASSRLASSLAPPEWPGARSAGRACPRAAWFTESFLATILGLLFVFVAGCKTTLPGPKFDARSPHPSALTNFNSVSLTNQLDPAFLRAPTNLFTLGPGDTIEIEIFGEPGSRATETVGPDGKIYFYLLHGLDVWGLTLPETKAAIERELKTLIKTEPQVGVTLRGVESKRVWILGRVANSGIFSLGTPMTLLEALSMAGGTRSASESGTTTELADLHHSFIIRNGKILPINFNELLRRGDMRENIYLEPDDFIYLPPASSREIYVLGAVRAPQAVSVGEPPTLLAAIAAAGGPIKNAYESHVAIVRGSLTHPEIAIVDYNAIKRGKATDVLLESHDIVYVPLSPYRFLTKYADLIVTTFVRAIAINEGARAVSENVTPVGVGININPINVIPVAPTR